MEKITNARIKEEYLRIKHKSGATILLYPMKGYSTAYALFATKYGSVDTTFKTNEDPDFVTVPEGIAHYLEHKLFENDECDAFDLYAKTGANANAYTSFDKTAYLFSCSQKFEENLRILLGFVQEPYFTDATVAKEQGIIGQEIRMYEDDTGWRVFFNCLQAMYEKNPVRIDIAGTIESIAKIDKDLLYRCYNTFYNLNNMVIAVAGNFDVDKTLEICDELLKPSEDHGLQVIVPDEPLTVHEKRNVQKLSCAIPLFNIGWKFPAYSGKEQLEKYTENETDETAILANASAVLGIALKDINWVGFYMVKGEELVLGPFQGKPAVSRIGYGKGVCGTGWAEKRTQLVADVHCFAGHIACDCNSNAEIVVPLLNDAGEVLGVLDIDSPVSGRFDGDDLDGLEAAAALLAKKIAG